MRMIKTISLALIAIGCGSLPLTVAAQTAAQTVSFDISEQPLGKALQTFGQQAGLQVVVYSEVSKGRMAPRVEGELTVEKALVRLLANSGLRYEYLNARTVAVLPESQGETGQAFEPGSDLRVVQGKESQEPAEGAGKEAKADDGSELELEEIVVTAQKRVERLIDTPQSVSVLTADTLARIGATQFRDFADTVPGLSFQTTGPGFTQVTLRGVTTGSDVGPTVGVYVDEVPYGSSSAFSLGAQQALDVGLFDVSRIEVLRGPQGTLYGASTMGGLIKYVTRQPDSSRFGVDVQLGTAGTQDGDLSYNAAVAVNTPIAADKAALRASGFYSHTGGFVDNLALDDSNADSAGIYGGRLDLLLTPTEAMSVRLGAFVQNVSRDGHSTVEYTPAGAPQFGSLEQFRLFPEPSSARFRLASGTLTYDFGAATLTSISSYQTAKADNTWDISSLYVPVVQRCCNPAVSGVRYPFETRTYKFTQELRLASAAGARPVEWVLGGFYTSETSDWEEEFVLIEPDGTVAPNNAYDFAAPSRYRETAGFGDLTWHLTEQFSLTGGLRHANNRQLFTQFGSGVFISSRPTARSDEDVTTYLANARYQLNDRANVYLRFATGYRPGGPNPAANDANGNPLGSPTFEADRLKSYEIGYKAETGDRRFGIDLAAYRIDWDNIQVLTFFEKFAFRVNAEGGARINGAELSVTARPISALTLSSGLAWQDAKLSDDESTLAAVEGQRLPNVPRFTASLNADYALPIGDWEPTVGATLRQVDERTTGFNAGAHRLPEYTSVDLRAGARFGTWNAQLYVRNLFDERGQLSSIFPQFGTRIAILQPLTIGLHLTTQF